MPTVGDAFTHTLITLKDNEYNWSLLDAACQRYDPQPHIIKYLIDKALDAFKTMLANTEPDGTRKEEKAAAKKAENNLLKFQTLWNLSDDYAARYAADKISQIDLLRKIEEAPDSIRTKVLEGPFIKAILNQKAIEVPCLSILFIELFLQMLTVFAFSFSFIREDVVVYDFFQVNVVTSQELSFCILGVSLFWFGLREIFQLSSLNILSYFNDTSNLFDLAQLVLIIVVLLTHVGRQGDHQQEGLALVCILVSWFRLIFIFGNLIFNVAVFVSALASVSFAPTDTLLSYHHVHFFIVSSSMGMS
jgi:hypothetical protein